jgi:hypothetical protein
MHIHELKMNVQPGMVGTPVIPVFKKLRQEDHKFKTCLDYIVRHSQKTKININ